jgi:adenylate kinase family enzyme
VAERPPRRIVVCGCSGAGKTVLARELGRRLDLPVTHLDALYYDERWPPAPPDEFVRRQREVVAGPRVGHRRQLRVDPAAPAAGG